MNSQPNNPLHGIKLADILEYLEETFGWTELGNRIPIRCFQKDPSIKSSLKFLRRTPWARDKVERLYLNSIKRRPHMKRDQATQSEIGKPSQTTDRLDTP